jgi:hypothetical protein
MDVTLSRLSLFLSSFGTIQQLIERWVSWGIAQDSLPWRPRRGCSARGTTRVARDAGVPTRLLNAAPREGHPKSGLRCHHPKWKTKTITEKKAIRYASTQPNLRHSRFDLGHHAQKAYPASRAFGTMINIWSHVGQAE